MHPRLIAFVSPGASWTVLHPRHSEPPSRCTQIGHDLNIEHHAGVFVIKNVTVDDELTDVPVIGSSNKNAIIVLNKDGVTEGMAHSAVLACQTLPVLRPILYATPVPIEYPK